MGIQVEGLFLVLEEEENFVGVGGLLPTLGLVIPTAWELLVGDFLKSVPDPPPGDGFLALACIIKKDGYLRNLFTKSN